MRNCLAFLLRLSLPLALAVSLGGAALAQPAPPDAQRELLDRLTGHWVLRGTIAGRETTHDIDARWVLDRGYVQLHEVARERDESGRPLYEALVYLVWEPKLAEYACLWLDSTGVAAFPPEGVGHAKPETDRIAFVFGDPDDGIYNTFTYDRANDAWTWAIDNASEGTRTVFARVSLTRD